MNRNGSFHRFVRRVMLMSAWIVFAPAAGAAEPPFEGVVNHFQGEIGWVDPENKLIVVDDNTFVLSGSVARNASLREGVTVYFRYRILNGQPVITDILSGQ